MLLHLWTHWVFYQSLSKCHVLGNAQIPAVKQDPYRNTCSFGWCQFNSWSLLLEVQNKASSAKGTLDTVSLCTKGKIWNHSNFFSVILLFWRHFHTLLGLSAPSNIEKMLLCAFHNPAALTSCCISSSCFQPDWAPQQQLTSVMKKELMVLKNLKISPFLLYIFTLQSFSSVFFFFLSSRFPSSKKQKSLKDRAEKKKFLKKERKKKWTVTLKNNLNISFREEKKISLHQVLQLEHNQL